MSDGGPSPIFRIRHIADLLGDARHIPQKASRLMAKRSHALLDRTLSSAGSLAAFLATPDMMRWSESITGDAGLGDRTRRRKRPTRQTMRSRSRRRQRRPLDRRLRSRGAR